MSSPPPFLYYGQQDAGSSSSEYNSIMFAVRMLLAKIRTLDLVLVLSCSNNGGVTAVGTVAVQVLVNQMTGDRNGVAHGTIYNVPYIRLQGGANAVILDPQPGDIGLCGFCSRDISAVKQAKGAANPGSFRMFDWADGIYIGGCLNGVPSTYIQFTSTGALNMVSPTQISMTVGGHSVIITSTGVTIDGRVFLTHEHSGVQTGGGNSGGVV